MSFGTVIRKLRCAQNMTQEHLAEILSVSPQAVSRWERDVSMPDISLIAPLCSIFNISSDALLEIDIKNKEEQINRYSDEYCKFSVAVNKTEELRQQTINRLREGLRLYPDAEILKRQLAAVLWLNSDKPADIEEKKEMCRLYGELIDETSDMEKRLEYIIQYCTYARFTGNGGAGKKYAQTLPDTGYIKKRLYAMCCEDAAERKERLFDYMRAAWGGLRDAMLLLITECDNSAEEILEIRKKQEKINEILFDGDSIVMFEDFDEYKIAVALYNAGDYSLAIDYLEICLTKWTEPKKAENVSPWREKQTELCLTDEEIKANAEFFIKSANTNFINLCSDKRMVNLIETAKRIAAS